MGFEYGPVAPTGTLLERRLRVGADVASGLVQTWQAGWCRRGKRVGGESWSWLVGEGRGGSSRSRSACGVEGEAAAAEASCGRVGEARFECIRSGGGTPRLKVYCSPPPHKTRCSPRAGSVHPRGDGHARAIHPHQRWKRLALGRSREITGDRGRSREITFTSTLTARHDHARPRGQGVTGSRGHAEGRWRRVLAEAAASWLRVERPPFTRRATRSSSASSHCFSPDGDPARATSA